DVRERDTAAARHAAGLRAAHDLIRAAGRERRVDGGRHRGDVDARVVLTGDGEVARPIGDNSGAGSRAIGVRRSQVLWRRCLLGDAVTTNGTGCAAIALALCAHVVPAGADPARYELDPEHLTIAFLVEHIGYARTLGQFTTATGSFTFDDATGALSAVRVT